MSVTRSLLIAVLALAPGTAADEPLLLRGTVKTRAEALAVAGARVDVPELALETTTDAEGRFSLELPLDQAGRSLRVRAQAPGLASVTRRLQVTDGEQHLSFDLQPALFERVGLGSRAARGEQARAVPVDVLTAEQIAATGLTETAQVLQALVPAFNFPRPTGTDGTDTVRPATLRGLGPDQVLVLVNGKRRHQSALVHLNGSIGHGSTGVDLNAIPVAAIERIEVLRDGASAQYGSDAIAGVIDIVLKSQPGPLIVSVQGGLQWGRFVGNRCSQDGLACEPGSVPFSDGELFDLSIAGAWPVRQGHLALAGEYRYHDRTNRASADPRDQLATGDAGDNPVVQPNQRWGDPDTRDVLLFADLLVPLPGSGTSFYAFGGLSRRASNSAGVYRRALDTRNWIAIYPLGFLPELHPTVLDGSLVAGLRGPLAGWAWDASFDYGRNDLDFEVSNSLNTSLGPRQPPNKTAFDAGQLVLDQLAVNLDARRPVALGPSRSGHLALGAELRLEHYAIHHGEPDAWRDGGVPDRAGGQAAAGAQGFPGFRPSNAVSVWRTSLASYADLEGDLARWLRLGLAGRFEHFSDFGGTLDGKLSVRLSPVRGLVLRGAAGTGFRAPSLGQSHFSSTTTNFSNVRPGGVQPFDALTLPLGSPAALALGATPLEPEQSRHVSAGLVLSPAARLDLAADLYRIDVDGRVALTGYLSGPPISELLLPFGADSARFFANALDTRTSGLDLTATWRPPADGPSGLRLQAGYHHNRMRIVGERATPPQLAGVGLALVDRVERRRLECGQPRDSARASAQWRRAAWGADLHLSHHGAVCSLSGDPLDDQDFRARWLTDLELSYHLPWARVGLGVQNALNVLPDRNLVQASFFGIQTFPGHSPFGLNGRFVYVRAALTF